MRDIAVGYFNLSKKNHLSSVVINENFLDLLSRCVNVKKIAVAGQEDLKTHFEKIEKYNLDYLYVDSYEALLHPFLLRERLRLDIPFIVTLHTIMAWASDYARMIPLIRGHDVIITPSKYAKESFSRISKKIDIHVIPNCLDTKYIQENVSCNDKPDNIKTITFMGRLAEKKGVRTLIRCMPELIDGVGDVYLDIIGPLSGSNITDSPKYKYVAELETEVKMLGLADRVNFRGVRFGLEKYRALSKSSVFVNPTLAEVENFPMVNIEAMACALPVIATDWAGNKEIIMDGENGYLVDVHDNTKGPPRVDTGQLVSSIAKVLTDPGLNLKLREGAAKTAQKYDYRRVFPRLVHLLKKRRPGGSSRWGPIKDKTVGDFDYLFNRDFLFFICGIDSRLRMETYGDLYNRMVEPGLFKIKGLPKAKEKIVKKSARYKKIMGKISRDYENFLCLRKF